MFDLVPFRPNRLMYPLMKEFLGHQPHPLMRADIYQEGSNYVLEAELPGFSKEEIKVEVVEDRLIISAQRKQEREEKSEHYLHRERSVNQVCRSFIIQDIDPEAIQAKYENGVLQLTLPKSQELQPKTRQIEIS